MGDVLPNPPTACATDLQIQCRDKHWQAIRSEQSMPRLHMSRGKVAKQAEREVSGLFINVRREGVLGTAAALKHGLGDYS